MATPMQPNDGEASKLLKFERLLAALEKREEGIGKHLADFRTSLSLNVDEFGLKIGRSGRTVNRWETIDAKPLTLAYVRPWREIFGLGNDRWSQDADSLPYAGDRLAGIFSGVSIVTRLQNAHEVVILKARSEFRGKDNSDVRRIFVDCFVKRKGDFRITCAWIKPEHIPDEPRNRNEARPSNCAQESFHTFRKYMLADETLRRENIPDLEDRISGRELTIAEAASVGLANSPVGIVAIVYASEVMATASASPEKAVSTEELLYSRPVDVFFELPIAQYDPVSRKRIGNEEPSWVQLHPPVAVDFWNAIWRQFKLLRKG